VTRPGDRFMSAGMLEKIYRMNIATAVDVWQKRRQFSFMSSMGRCLKLFVRRVDCCERIPLATDIDSAPVIRTFHGEDEWRNFNSYE
jgi:hypothetical protein